jgi:lycopene cyclase domain-containing protein
MNTEYLMVLCAMLSVPLIASFNRRLNLYRRWRAMGLSIGIMTALFVIWDIVAVHRGHWWFNESYVTGAEFAGLPVEEWLFFIVLGFVSIFTFEAVSHLMRRKG